MPKKRKPLPRAGGPERPLEDIWLVQPPIGGGPTDVAPPLGLLLLGAILEAEGKRPHLADLNLKAKQGKIDPKRSLRTQLLSVLPKRKSQVDLIGVTTWSYNFDVAMEFVEAARKKHPQAPIVLGGPHVTFVDREALSTFPSIDYVLRDEGDLTFPRLVSALERGGRPEELAEIPGLTWRRGGEVVRNPSGSIVEDLDALPFPKFDLIDVRDYLAQQPTLTLEAGRGCPYNCNFCSTTNMFQRRYRVKSPVRMVDELQWAMRETGGRVFELLHDNLVANKKHVIALCREIRKRNIDVEFSCTSRTDNLTEEVAEELFLAGCESIFFGIETLDAERQKWTGKGLDPPKVHEAVEMTRRQHIQPTLGIILGFPEETAAELDATVAAAVRWTTEPKIQASISTAVLRYYPGADLFQNADQLHYDALAAADASALGGYETRPEWREHRRLFPTQMIHTEPHVTRTNMLRRNFVRTLLKVAPHTLRACGERLGLPPLRLLAYLEAARDYTLLTDRRQHVIVNEVVGAFAEVLENRGDPRAIELLTCEVPFWRTTPVIEPTDALEHVIAPKRYDQAELLDWAHGRRDEPAELADTSLLAIRTGPEAVVWFTKQPDELWGTFAQSYATDRQGTIDYVNSLRRGL